MTYSFLCTAMVNNIYLVFSIQHNLLWYFATEMKKKKLHQLPWWLSEIFLSIFQLVQPHIWNIHKNLFFRFRRNCSGLFGPDNGLLSLLAKELETDMRLDFSTDWRFSHHLVRNWNDFWCWKYVGFNLKSKLSFPTVSQIIYVPPTNHWVYICHVDLYRPISSHWI